MDGLFSFIAARQEPLYLIISVGVDENVYSNPDIDTALTVDYVRCYQYK